MYRFCLSFYYFLYLFIKKRRYDVIFYYPQHFNRGKKGENYFFQHHYEACKKKNLSYIVFEEPYQGSLRNQETIPFDFIFYLIVLLRKLFRNQSVIEKDRRIGSLLSYTIFRNIKFNNVIVLSKSMLSVFSAIQPSCRIFDNQHGIIYSNKSDYFNGDMVAKQLVANDIHLLIFGDEFRNILIEQDSTNFMNSNSHVIGSPLFPFINHNVFNNNVLVTLQFTHDHHIDENLKLLEELHDFIHSAGSDIIFHLKHHPRFDNALDLSDLLKLSNVKLSPSDINDCFKICSLHATAYSTSTFEAALQGIPTVLIQSQDWSNFFKIDFSYPLHHTISDFSDVTVYQESARLVKRWAQRYYSAYNESTFLSLLQ